MTAAREDLDDGRELTIVDDNGALLVLGIGTGTSSGLDSGLCPLLHDQAALRFLRSHPPASLRRSGGGRYIRRYYPERRYAVIAQANGTVKKPLRNRQYSTCPGSPVHRTNLIAPFHVILPIGD